METRKLPRKTTVSLLVSPPLHLSLVVADEVSLLALRQVGDTAELLVVIHRLVVGSDAVHNTWTNGKQQQSGIRRVRPFLSQCHPDCAVAAFVLTHELQRCEETGI